MTAAPDLSPAEAARVARFDAAPPLVESSAAVRAMLALAEEADRVLGVVPTYRIRDALSAALAADPEPLP